MELGRGREGGRKEMREKNNNRRAHFSLMLLHASMCRKDGVREEGDKKKGKFPFANTHAVPR